MRAEDMDNTASRSRKVNSQEKLSREISLLVKLIEDTQFAEPIDSDVIILRKIYHDCLNWRLEAISPNSPPL